MGGEWGSDMRQPIEGVSYHRAPPSRVLGSLGKCETHSSELARAGVEGLDDAGPTPLSHDAGRGGGDHCGRGRASGLLLVRQTERWGWCGPWQVEAGPKSSFQTSVRTHTWASCQHVA